MTKDNNIKFVPVAPKTYEVRYVDLTVKEPSKITKLAGYLGVKTVYNCNGKPCSCVSSTTSGTTVQATPSTQADIVASAISATSKVGGSVEIKTGSDGSTTVNYDSGKSAK